MNQKYKKWMNKLYGNQNEWNLYYQLLLPLREIETRKIEMQYPEIEEKIFSR